MQFTQRTKQRYIPHTFKKNKKNPLNFSGVRQKSKASSFFWSPSMTKYLFLLQILHFEMQIFEHEKKNKLL